MTIISINAGRRTVPGQGADNQWEERFYTPPPGSDFRDCDCAGIETNTPPPLGGGGGGGGGGV